MTPIPPDNTEKEAVKAAAEKFEVVAEFIGCGPLSAKYNSGFSGLAYIPGITNQSHLEAQVKNALTNKFQLYGTTRANYYVLRKK